VDHERLGDEHYREGRYPQALAEYRAAWPETTSPEAWGKLGAAALGAGDFATAVEAFEQLGLADPTRRQEAARGLERVIRAASRPGGRSAVAASAIVALRRVAPERPLARQVLGSTGLAELGREEALQVLPAALGSADRSGEVDRLLLEYARALETTTACEAAVEAYRTILRRGGGPRLRAEARGGLGGCALRLGLDALAADQAAVAEEWFTTAIAVDTAGPVGLRARLGLGEARLKQGDVLGAAIWYQSVLAMAQAPDSLRQLAAARLNALGGAVPPEGKRP
jgi:tetratricopeptide (TPR) repeat protein